MTAHRPAAADSHGPEDHSPGPEDHSPGPEDHSHGSKGHTHGVNPNADKRYLSGALVLIVAFMAAEVVVGIIAQSLALISDAGHMLTDAASIVLALWAISLAARPAQGRLHLRVQTRRDPLRAGQRDHPAAAGGLVHLRGHPPAVRPARGRRAAWCSSPRWSASSSTSPRPG